MSDTPSDKWLDTITKNVDHAIWLPSDSENPLPRVSQERILQGIGIPRGRVYTKETPPVDGHLETGLDALALLERIFEKTPEARTLLIFPGRVQGMRWEDLVVGTWSVIARRTAPDEIAQTADSVRQILEKAGQVRAALATKAYRSNGTITDRNMAHWNALCDMRAEAAKIKRETAPLPEAVRQAMRKKVMFNMVTAGDDCFWHGKLAAECGVISDAFEVMQIASDTHNASDTPIFAASIRRQLCESGVPSDTIRTL